MLYVISHCHWLFMCRSVLLCVIKCCGVGLSPKILPGSSGSSSGFTSDCKSRGQEEGGASLFHTPFVLRPIKQIMSLSTMKGCPCTRTQAATQVHAPGRRLVVSVAAQKEALNSHGPPPAWPRRVVAPEVEPRSTPKVTNNSPPPQRFPLGQ